MRDICRYKIYVHISDYFMKMAKKGVITGLLVVQGQSGCAFGMPVIATHGTILKMRNCCPQTFSLPFIPDELY